MIPPDKIVTEHDGSQWVRLADAETLLTPEGVRDELVKAGELVVADPVGSDTEFDEDGRPLWYCEVQTVGGYSVIAEVWGGSPEQAAARGEAIRSALSRAGGEG